MPQLLINAVSGRVGGGVNDLVHTLPLLDERLRQAGWAVHTWVVAPGYEALRAAGYPADRLTRVTVDRPRQRVMWEFVRFPRIVKRTRPAAVFQFSNFIFRKVAAPQLTVLRSLAFFSRNYAAETRRGVYQKLRFRLGCRYSERTIRNADAVFCISATQRREIILWLGELGEKVRVAHLGSSLPEEAARLREADKSAVLEELPPALGAELTGIVRSKRPLVLNVAHYYSQKNLGDLLHAAAGWSSLSATPVLVLTAGITRYEGPHNDRTREEVALARNLADRGALVDVGPVSKANVWRLLALADVFVFPSSVESFGHPLLEAMSMHVPVVAADTDIHREIGGEAILAYRVGDSEELSRCVRRVLGGDVDVCELVNLGEERTKCFTWQTHVDSLIEAILKFENMSAPKR